MPELPWVQWYPTNWASEPGLRLCEAATRGIWFEAVNTMFLQNAGSISGTIEQLAAMCACRIPQMELAIQQLKTFKVADVCEQNGNTILTCRRISRDLKIKDLRRKAGLASATKRQHTVNTVYPTPSAYAYASASSSKGIRKSTRNLKGDEPPPANTVDQSEKVRMFQIDQRFKWLEAELCAFYHRPRSQVGVGEEQVLVAEVARRMDVKTEWSTIKAYRGQIEARYFPQSLASLCRDWEKTLDRARNHETPKSEETLLEKNIEAVTRRALKATENYVNES